MAAVSVVWLWCRWVTAAPGSTSRPTGGWLRRRWAVAGPGSTSRPTGGWREACGAWPGFETTRRAKLVARTASGRAGLAPHGGLAAGSVLGGVAAVPVGGGRARAGLEIEHSERSSRVAISRAGRRPPAHRAAIDNKMRARAARRSGGGKPWEVSAPRPRR